MANIMADVIAYCLNPNEPTFRNMLKKWMFLSNSGYLTNFKFELLRAFNMYSIALYKL